MDSTEILTRLRLLEDERAITRTLYHYAHAQYSGDKRQFLNCFTDDAIIERSRHGKIIVGHDEIAEYFDAISHAPVDYHKHVVIEPIIEIDGDAAIVSSDFLYVQRNSEGPFISHFGHYADEMVRDRDGNWRFTRRQLLTEAAAPGPNATIKGSPGRDRPA